MPGLEPVLSQTNADCVGHAFVTFKLHYSNVLFYDFPEKILQSSNGCKVLQPEY